MRLSFEKIMNITLSACLAATTFASATASAQTTLKLTDASLTESEPMGITLDDLVRYSPTRVHDAALLKKFIASSDSRIFKAGESICTIPTAGVSHTMQSGKVLTKYPTAKTICGGAYLEEAPHVDEDSGSAIYPLAIMMQTAAGPAFRKVNIAVGSTGKTREVTDVQVVSDVLLSQTHFSVSVGLVSNTQVVQDAQNGLLIVSPIGNGGLSLDTGSSRRILTPMFKNAMLRKDMAIPALGPPVEDAYYRMEPYIPLVSSTGKVEPIAFHVTILSDSLWNNGAGSEYLVRGYQSHGCMRMRLHDLLVLYTIVTQSAGPLPVNVDYFAALAAPAGQAITDAQADAINAVQPYPLTHNSFFQEKNQNAGTNLPPVAARDTDPKIVHHLIVMESVAGKVPYAKLVGFDGEDEAALTEYQGLLAKQTGVSHKATVKKVVAPKEDPNQGFDVTPMTATAPAAQPVAAQ